MKKQRPKHNVLIADDHKIFRVGLSAILRNVRSVGTVYEALNGKEAIDLLGKINCDFVFMDIKMPVMDGVAATRAIAKTHPDVHVIAMSVYDDDHYLKDMFESGAKGYLLKNTDQEEIETAMETVLAGKVYLSKTVSDKLVQQLRFGQSGSGPQRTVQLTPREKEILYYLWLEMSSKEIAAKIFISHKTVELYRSRLMEKINCKNTVALVKFAIQHGIVKEMEARSGSV